jgi:vesicle-associated membrane protein 7
MHYHNIHHKEIRQEEKVTRLLAQVQDIRDVMGRNLNMILERGERFEGLLTKSEGLNADAQVFRKKARTAKSALEQKYYFWYAVIAFIFLVFLYMTVVSTCGVRLEHCRTSNSTSSGGGSDNSNGDYSNGGGGN